MLSFEKDNSVNRKHTLFAWFLLVFLVGLGLRLWRLGEMKFTLAEAQLAENAWQMAMGRAQALPGNMSYAGLSAILFYLFEPSFFFARLVTVIAGSSLILVPWFWRHELGEKVALVLAIGLAFDPILVSFSRQIVTPILAVAGIAWAVTTVKNKRTVLTGSMLAVGFLGGYSFWVIAVVGLTALIVFHARKKEANLNPSYKAKEVWLPLLVSFVISTLVISTGFLLCTEALGGIGAGLVEFIQLFGSTYKIALYRPIIIGIAYSILPLVFMIWAFIDELISQQSLKSLPALIGWGVSLLLSVLLGRQDLGLLVVASVFAWIGAAEFIARSFESREEQKEIVLGVTLFQLVILVYMLMVGQRMAGSAALSQDFTYSLFALLAGVLLLVISTLLVGFGWSRQVSGQALRYSLVIMLTITTLGIGLRSINTQQESNSLSLLAGPIVLPNNDVVIVTDEIDREGRADKTEITYDLGDLGTEFSWFLREQDAWESKQSTVQADLMLSLDEADFSAADNYRGRNVVLYRDINTAIVTPGDLLGTIFGESLPLISQNGILWVRLDLFTGAN